jgi:hypothetical protein
VLRLQQSLFAVLLSATISGACSRQPEQAHILDGQWAIELTRSQPTASADEAAQGVIVWDANLPRYPDDPVRPDTAIGRAYLNFRSLSSDARDAGEEFAIGRGADRLETAHAVIGVGDTVQIDLAAHVVGSETILRGVLRGDSIVGQWTLQPYGLEPLHGTFRMWRTERDAYHDSATSRSRRAVERWHRD